MMKERMIEGPMENLQTVKVSVIVPTYKHEKYIAKALESIVSQKINFPMEVLVGEDCSPDHTVEIVREYGDKYPDLIFPLIREKNLGMSGNMMDLIMRSRGEYVAFLEGDDYWIDENKLQKQVEFLDAHKDYVAVFGKCIVVNEEGVRTPEWENYITFFQGGEYTTRHYQEYLLPGQTATAVYRKKGYEELRKIIEAKKIDTSHMIDRGMVLCMLSIGKMYTLEDELAAYRYVLTQGSGSWSSQNDFFSVKNVGAYLNGLKEMEELAGKLGLSVNFDERRKKEFSKISEYKGTLPKEDIRNLRKIIFRDFNKKSELWKFLCKRQIDKVIH